MFRTCLTKHCQPFFLSGQEGLATSKDLPTDKKDRPANYLISSLQITGLQSPVGTLDLPNGMVCRKARIRKDEKR